MGTKIDIEPQMENELVICRMLDIPVEKAYRAWTDAKLLPEWFAPKPWTLSKAEIDVRPGGGSLIVMKGPDGQEMPCPGMYLEVIPNKKLVFTDAFTAGYVPTGNPFMVATITFEDVGGKTKYTARARHWSKKACEQHQKMGFEEGWAVCADQLEALMKRL